MEATRHVGSWAVCPTPSGSQQDSDPLIFRTLNEANAFLNAEVPLRPADEEAESLGVTVDEVLRKRDVFEKERTEAEKKLSAGEIGLAEFPLSFQRYYNRDCGWLKPVPAKSLIRGPRVGILFREFLSITQLGTPVRPTLEQKIKQVMDGTMPEFSCYLSDSWRFDEIEQNLELRISHRFEGRKYSSVAEIILLELHDLEGRVYEFHPEVGAASIGDLFLSWQLWRHVAKFSKEVGESDTAALITGLSWAARSQAEEAQDMFYKEFCAYAHAITPILASQEGWAAEAIDSEHEVSPVWLDLARRFREIDPYELLTLDWQLATNQIEYPGSLMWGVGGSGEAVQARFIQLAAIAGKYLSPQASDPSGVWFKLIKDSLPHLPYRVDAVGKQWILRHACEISARLCALQDPTSEILPIPMMARSGEIKNTKVAANAKPPRLPRTISSMPAARRLEKYLEATGIGITEFAGLAETTDRTLRNFRRTGKVQRGIFDSIAKAMGVTREDLLKPEN